RERAVVGRRDVLHRAVAHPHHHVLPVVAVAAEADARQCLVLLEVEGVDDGAPAVVARGARVAVGVLQVGGVPAVAVEGAGRLEPGVDGAVRTDGRGGVAAVLVVVVGGLEGPLQGVGVGRQGRGRRGEGGGGEGQYQRGGSGESGQPSPAVGPGRARRHCVLLLV